MDATTIPAVLLTILVTGNGGIAISERTSVPDLSKCAAVAEELNSEAIQPAGDFRSSTPKIHYVCTAHTNGMKTMKQF